jgi:hypothetical protein
MDDHEEDAMPTRDATLVAEPSPGIARDRLDPPGGARAAFRALAARVSADYRATAGLAEACDLRLRVWEAGARGEDWRLVVVRRASGRTYQVRRWEDWERAKRLATAWPPAAGGGGS